MFITCAAVAARAAYFSSALHVLGRLDRTRHDLGYAEHQRLVEHPAQRLAVRDPRVLAVPDRVRRPAPRQRERELVLARDGELVVAGLRIERHVGVLLEVVRAGECRVEQDRLRRGDRRAAAPEHRDVEGVEAGRLQRELGRDLAGGVHLRDARREEQAGGREVGAVLLVARDQPVLLTGRVGVVRACGEARLDDLRPPLAERPDGVEHHGRTGEQLGQRRDVVGHLDDLVVSGLDAGDVALHRGLQLAAVAAGGDEGDVVLAEVLADQPAGVAGGAVDDDGLVAHGSHPHSAVDRQADSVDEARGVGGQEHHGVGHVGDLAEPAGGCQLDDGADRFLG